MSLFLCFVVHVATNSKASSKEKPCQNVSLKTLLAPMQTLNNFLLKPSADETGGGGEEGEGWGGGGGGGRVPRLS